MHNVAKVILYDEDGSLVMQQRDRGGRAKDKLSFFGGGIEEDEAYDVAALRELEEETNIEASLSELTYVYSRFVWNGTHMIHVHYYALKHPISTEALKIYEGRGFALLNPRKLMFKRSLSPLARRAAWKVRRPKSL